MSGVEHAMLMPGMLTEAQMKQLDAARGAEFDRLFLTFMIQHHQRRRVHGEGAVRHVRRRPGRDRVQVRHRTSTSIRPPRSTACRRCSSALRLATSACQCTSQGARHMAVIALSLALAVARSPSALASAGRVRHSTVGTQHVQPTVDAEPDPRVGLKAGLIDAGEAVWNLRVLSKTPPSEKFVGDHQLRPRVHRQLRHSGQLQRLPGLGHLEPGAARRSRRRTSARRRRATCRSTRTCSSSPARRSTAGSTAGPRA